MTAHVLGRARRRLNPRARWFIPALAAALAAATLTEGSTASASAQRQPARPAGPPVVREVTLVTGDVVQVATSADGRRSVSLRPGPDGVVPQAAINEDKRHLYVVPRTAMHMLATKQLDRRLFDIDELIADGYDDSSRSTLPVIVDFGRGTNGRRRAAHTTLTGASRTHAFPELGAAAYSTDKRLARSFWAAVTTSTGSEGSLSHLTRGLAHIDLDGVVHALDTSASLQQIHAPDAWAAGYDGTGVTVAVLDTGYDTTHPDLTDRVAESANFTADDSVADGNGHGTHVASTIAGSGSASGGTYRGVAPGASLLVGKVLDDTGTGADSQVMAGMSWAVAHHADVVSMSLGGDAGDGTGPLERAVDELSTSSTTLFVIAAGNAGPSPMSVTAPGAAATALTVGAVDGADAMADFSSRGPLVNGELKPNVVAPGVDIVAARAAGTSLGTPVDANYTALSGTSMATPQVAGIAALLKQEHPTWSGALVKDAISSSAVTIDKAGAFDAGTGRVDAARAVAETVLTDPTLDLGYLTWPHATLAPRSKDLTYTNLGDAPVTLALTVGTEDGSSTVPGVTLGEDHLTIPAGGQASVPVTLDPTVEPEGAFSGVVTATVEGGSGKTVRTFVAYYLEPERYDLTVQITPRSGTQEAAHQVSLLSYADYSFDQRELDAAPGQRTVTFRVPPGSYSATVVSYGQAADDSSEGVLDVRPFLDVHHDTSVLVDENTSRRFGHRTDRPVVEDGSVMYAGWSGPHGEYSEGAIYGRFDRLYAHPMASAHGSTVNAQLYQQLSQPEAELHPDAGSTIGLRPVPTAWRGEWLTPVPRVSGSHAVISAGSTSHLVTGRVRGALALVSVSRGACPDLRAAARTLKAAGAVGLITYPGHGQTCVGTLASTPVLPTFQARPVDGHRLKARSGHPASVVSHSRPEYVYDLATGWTRVPFGALVDARGAQVAAMVETVRSMGGSSPDGLGVYDHFVGWIPGLGKAAFGLQRRVPPRSTVTHYVSAGAAWERDLDVLNDRYLGTYLSFFGPPKTLKGGSTMRETWLGGPVGDRVSSSIGYAYGPRSLPNRQGDNLYAVMAPLTDSAGHVGSTLIGETQTARLYANGSLLVDAWDPLMLNGLPVDPAPTPYVLEFGLSRSSAGWKRSTNVHTRWGFMSSTSKKDVDVLPLLGVRYAMALSAGNVAPAGRAWSFGLRVEMPAYVVSLPVSTPNVQISWNDGHTWSKAAVSGCVHPVVAHGGRTTSCTVRVTNHSSGFASLRVRAKDSAHDTVDQTIIRAYAVG